MHAVPNISFHNFCEHSAQVRFVLEDDLPGFEFDVHGHPELLDALAVPAVYSHLYIGDLVPHLNPDGPSGCSVSEAVLLVIWSNGYAFDGLGISF